MTKVTMSCAAAFALLACGRDRESSGTAQAPSVEKVADDPSRLYGKRLTLAGEVDDVLGPRAFTVKGEGVFIDADEVIVLTKTPPRFAGMAVEADDDVIATGTIRPGVVAELEREIGWDLEPQLEAEIQRRPVLVADTLRQVGEYSRWSSDPTQTQAGLLAIVMESATETLTGQRVHFDRAEVQGVTRTGVWVGPSNDSAVLVIPVNPAMLSGIEVGDRVLVTGTVRDRTPEVNRENAAIGRDASARIFIEAMQLQAPPEGRLQPPAS